MFWKINGAGYSSNLNDAEIFSKEEAQKYAVRQYHFIPLSKTEVDKIVSIRVDCQYLDETADTYINNWVLVRLQRWDGNDVYFRTDHISDDALSYKAARVYTKSDALKVIKKSGGKYKAYPLSHIKTIARRTIAYENVSIRIMTQNSGIKYRAPRKQRETSGKTRMNCPRCGQINWQYNPYDFDGCKNARCDEWEYLK